MTDLNKRKFRLKIDYLFPLLVTILSTVNLYQQLQNPNIPSVVLSIVGIAGVLLFFLGIRFFSTLIYIWILLQLISYSRETYDTTYQVWVQDQPVFDLSQGFKFGFGYYWINGINKSGIYLNFIAIAFFALLRILEVSAMVGRRAKFRPFHLDGDYSDQFPLSGIIEKRVVVSGEKNWLQVGLDSPFNYEGTAISQVLIKSKEGTVIRAKRKEELVHFRLVQHPHKLASENLSSNDFPFLEWVWCKL